AFCDLCADGLDSEVGSTHDDHGLDPVDRVFRAVVMDRGHAAVVTGVHRLEHVQGFRGTALTDHDPVGAHPQRVDHQVPNAARAAALDVGTAGLERHQVALAKLQLGGVLHRNDPLGIGDEVR